MGWFDNQIRLRKKNDHDGYEHTLRKIAGAVTGKSASLHSADDEAREEGVINEILTALKVSPRPVPDKLKSLDERLEYALHPYGIMRRDVELERGWYRDAYGVMLGYFKEDKTPVALVPTGLSGYSFTDPKTGMAVKICKDNEGLFDTDAYVFYKPFPLKKLNVIDLMKFIVSMLERADYVIVILASLLVMLTGLLVPRINYFLFGSVVREGSMTLLVSTGFFLLFVSIGSLLLNSAKSLISARIETRMSLCVEAATMMRVLSMPASFFKDYGSGELSARASYVNSLCSTLVSVILNSGLTSILSLVYITQIFQYAPALLIPALLVITATVLFTVISSFLQMRLTKKQMLIDSKENGMSYALISGIQKIKLTGAEMRAFSRWGDLYSESAKLSYAPPLFIKLNSVISLAIPVIGTIIMYNAAIVSHVTVAEYYAFNTAYGMVMGAFMSLFSMALSAANIRPVLEMAMPLLKTEPEACEDKEILTAITGGVDINNLSFKYTETSPFILDNISLKIRPGQYVAIVGKTGCGKSTLVRLLLGFEKPYKGAIYYDGRDICKIDLKSLRKHIGVVTQNGRLFSGDIYSNIVVAAPHLTLDEAWEAARIAGMEEDIKSMPMGMNTLISEGGGGISGGQKQRIMIARAVAPKPKLLIFDEATSALDNITQRKVSRALDEMKCTRIVIAHRLSTIKECDRILVLDKGHIVEDGTYEELVELKGCFYDLVKRQQVDFA